MQSEELAGWLRLAWTSGVGSGSARKLLAAFGPPAAVFAQSQTALSQVVTPAQAAALAEPPDDFPAQLDRTLGWLAVSDDDGAVRRIVTLGDPDYPASLLQTVDPPPILYTLGAPSFTLRNMGRSIAIVGSRNPTPQGVLNARAFGRAFGELGITVISGLALGVDGAAHEGALDASPEPGAASMATVAVVGTGLDRVYPARHRALAHRIAARGLIVSEFPLGTPPLNQNFPLRNRIIAGLGSGTLVVEAALQSGSLITARLAAEQGKEVFAIPGSIHAPQSRGCHALIRQGAKLVESVADVLEELRWPAEVATAASAGGRGAAGSPASGEHAGAAAEDAVLRDMGFDPVSLDALCARTGFDAATLQARLLELELSGCVARLPGGLFQRIAAA